MSYTITISDVEKIIEVDSDITTDLAPFIEAANQVVTNVCSSTYTDAQLKLIAVWLTAHFYSIRDPQAQDEKAGSVAARFFGKVDLALDQTRWGQQAMAVDYLGDLAQLNQQMKKGKKTLTPGMTWLGAEDWDEDNIGT